MARPSVWWKRFLRPKPARGEGIAVGDLVLVPSSQTAARAEDALPGTRDLEPLIRLVPPPVDPDPGRAHDPAVPRDYGPSPIAEWSLTFEARDPFDCADLAAILHATHEQFGRPMHHVRTPEGRITYLVSSNAPPRGIALIPAWSLGSWAEPDAARIFSGAEALAARLASLPQGFTAPEMSLAHLERQLGHAARVAAIAPRTARIEAVHPDGAFWDGREIWTLLHRLGLTWGDMDCFQWADPTQQTDYLIWAEVDDGDLGYALPERIAAGAQHFRALRFSVNIPRSPAPAHAVGQMERIASACQQVLGCRLLAFVDDEIVAGPAELHDAVAKVVTALAALGLKPGSDSVCRLI